MDEIAPLGPGRTPTTRRPLLGMTVLVVEDSRYASEALRLMCLHSGARIRRADCLRAARRHLQVYRPSVVIVDLGLPDGSGLDLIAELSRAVPRVGALIATSGELNAEQPALAAGADAFLGKPLVALGSFQHAILSVLPPERRPAEPALVNTETVKPDTLAYRDDMHHVADLLEEPHSGPVLDYVAQFLGSVAAAAEDGQMHAAAQDLSRALRANRPFPRPEIAHLLCLVKERTSDRVAI